MILLTVKKKKKKGMVGVFNIMKALSNQCSKIQKGR